MDIRLNANPDDEPYKALPISVGHGVHVNGIRMRYITVKIILDNGTYKESHDQGSNVMTLTCNSFYGHCNASISIVKAGLGFSGESANITIHGFDKNTIEQLLYMQQISPEDLGINAVEVYAGDYKSDESGLPNFIYRGQVFAATLPSIPASNDIGLVIDSLSGGNSLNEYTQTTSIEGNTSVERVIRNIISKAEYGYTPNINIPAISVTDIHLSGNWRIQLADICKKFRLKFRIDADIIRVAPYENILAVGKKAAISSNNVMQGSPQGGNRSVIVNTWYDSDLIYGQKITMSSQFDYFNGDYIIIGMKINIANNDDAWDNQLTLMRYYGK